MTETSVGGRLNKPVVLDRSAVLRDVSFEELGAELLARINDREFANESTVSLGCRIQDALRLALDVHCNRMSRQRYRDMFGLFKNLLSCREVVIEGATIVDLGCGSINPYGLLFLFLMLGAKRGIAIDLDEVQDFPMAIRALGDCAGMMLTDPSGIVGSYPIEPEQVLCNISSFDLAKLGAGDASGIDGSRLSLIREPVSALSLADGEADLVISNAFLEHVTPVDEAISELSRITRTGGFNIHNIDGADHWRYTDPNCHPLAFLMDATNEALVHGSNRIRPRGFVSLFERHGFEFVDFIPFERIEISNELREQFVEPFRSMSDEVLSVVGGNLLLRRI